MAVDLTASVLVVDDIQMMSDLVIRLMQRLGFKDIDHAVDGAAAWERLQGKRYGLVISDLEMENMDGVDLLERLAGNVSSYWSTSIASTNEKKPSNRSNTWPRTTA